MDPAGPINRGTPNNDHLMADPDPGPSASAPPSPRHSDVSSDAEGIEDCVVMPDDEVKERRRRSMGPTASQLRELDKELGPAQRPYALTPAGDGEVTSLLDVHSNTSKHSGVLSSLSSRISNGSFFITSEVDSETLMQQNKHQHKGHATLLSTVVTIVSSLVGGGVLALSTSFDDASIVWGIVALIIVGSISAVAAAMLVHACEESNHYSYLQLWHHSVKNKYLTRMVGIFIVLYNMGSCAAFAVIIKDSMGPLAKGWFKLNGFTADGEFWVLLVAPVLFVLSSLRNLSELVWTSVFAFLTILYVGIVVLIRYPEMDTPDNINISEFKPNFWKALSTVSFCFAMHYNYPVMYKELKDRSPYKMAIGLASGKVVVIAFYLVVALIGYLSWGSAIRYHGGDLLAHYPDSDDAMNLGRFFMLFHFVFVFPLSALAARRSANIMLFGGERRLTRATLLIEAFVGVVISVLLATYVSKISTVVAFSGALFGMPIMLVFPPVIYMRVFPGISKLKRAGAVCMFVFGVVLMVVALITTINDEVNGGSE